MNLQNERLIPGMGGGIGLLIGGPPTPGGGIGLLGGTIPILKSMRKKTILKKNPTVYQLVVSVC